MRLSNPAGDNLNQDLSSCTKGGALMLTPKALVERLIASGIARFNQISGCTEIEIKDLQGRTGLKLPSAYVDFLSSVGHGAGGFLQDLDVYWPKMFELNAEAKEILENWEEGKLLLPDQAFVFSMRYGEQFLFFIADRKSENPPVHHYYEGHGHFTRVAASFWDAIECELRMSEDVRRKYPDSPFFA
jgi:hypothetical protein